MPGQQYRITVGSRERQTALIVEIPDGVEVPPCLGGSSKSDSAKPRACMIFTAASQAPSEWQPGSSRLASGGAVVFKDLDCHYCGIIFDRISISLPR